MTQAPSTKPRTRFTRFNVSVAAVVFLTLAGTSAATASWTAPAAITSATVTTGTLTVSQATTPSLNKDFNSTGTATQLRTVAVTVTNSGSIPAPFTLTLGGTSANGLAAAITVNSWPATSASQCTDAATLGGAAKNWTTAASQTGTLAAGVSAFFCVRTALTPSQISETVIGTVAATVTVASNIGSWTSGNSTAVVQKALDTTAPTVPGKPVASATTGSQTTLTWAASTDNVKVVAYDIYRNNVLVGSSTTNSYTDAGLTALTAYSYTVKARDDAPLSSAASAATSVTTGPPVYTVTSPASGFCLDAEGAGTTSGTRVIAFPCHGGSNQSWTFAASGKISALYDPSLFIRPDSNSTSASIEVVDTGTTRTAWTLVPVSGAAGQYQIKNNSTGYCLDMGANPTQTPITPVTQKNCTGAPSSQRFTLTVVNSS